MTPELRRAFARRVMAAAGVADTALEDAFATVPRERFLGPGPWQIVRPGRGYVTSPGGDPAYVNDDVLVGLVPERGLNNGMPSFHALLLGEGLRPEPGWRVAHVGAGTGYYSAIIAEMVGPEGLVRAIEIDGDLATVATRCLDPWPQVEVVAGDGAGALEGPLDGIYVSAGAGRIAESWLTALKPGGRLVAPLTAHEPTSARRFGVAWRGAAFVFTRRDADAFDARFLCPTAIYACEGAGAGDDTANAMLWTALGRGGAEFVRSLRPAGSVPAERCWTILAGRALAYDALDP